MTWHAPVGELVLQGEEAALFRDAILQLCDMIDGADEENAIGYGGIVVFDEMTRTQQAASLEKVSQYLFHETDECLQLSAWSEATLATVLQQIRAFVEIEARMGDDSADELRRFLIKQLEAEVSPVDWNERTAWDCLLESYEARFLWDNDFADQSIADLPPDRAEQLRKTFGIDEDYFSDIPPDLTHASELGDVKKRVWMVIDGKKTIKITTSLTVEIPASIPINQDQKGNQTVLDCFPKISMMLDPGDGHALEVQESLRDFFFHGSEREHKIEELPDI